MAIAAIVQAWKDVTDQINKKQGSWSVSFKAERKYQPKTALEQTGQVQAQTAIAAWRISLDNRTDWSHEFDIDIALQWRAKEGAADQATEQFDNVLLLAQELTDYWEDTRPTVADCPLVRIAFPNGDGPYIPEHIETLDQITTVIRLTFQKLR
jgi:hypothetical protein